MRENHGNAASFTLHRGNVGNGAPAGLFQDIRPRGARVTRGRTATICCAADSERLRLDMTETYRSQSTRRKWNVIELN